MSRDLITWCVMDYGVQNMIHRLEIKNLCEYMRCCWSNGTRSNTHFLPLLLKNTLLALESVVNMFAELSICEESNTSVPNFKICTRNTIGARSCCCRFAATSVLHFCALVQYNLDVKLEQDLNLSSTVFGHSKRRR